MRRRAPGAAGQGLVEYSLILALVVVIAAIALLFFGPQLAWALSLIGTQIDWNVQESVMERDSVTNETKKTVLHESVPFTSTVSKTVTLNVAKRIGPATLAADIVQTQEHTTWHTGMETWLGLIALRAGANIDTYQQLQYATGVGLKLGKIGLDLAVASNSRNLSRERGLELGAGLAWYH